MEEDRLITTDLRSGEENFDNSLRPKWFNDYIGQDSVKEKLKIFVNAAKMRGEPLDHVLLYGPPGLGKTTLANIIANEMGVNIKITSGPAIERPGDLASVLTNLKDDDVLFIDEIHRISRSVEEISRFTLIGATTRAGLLSSPLRDRFGVILNLDLYDEESLCEIVTRSAGILDVNIDEEGAREIARRSRGTPRIANRLLKRVRDYSLVLEDGSITGKIAKKGLDILEIDHYGLDKTDRKILDVMINTYGGNPVGLDTLAASSNEERTTVEDVYEPYLIQLGFIARTPRGRIATKLAYEHMGYKYDKGDTDEE